MSGRYVPVSWKLPCPWCAFFIWVNPRGQRGNDPGAGVEAATIMRAHVEDDHAKTWADFLGAKAA